MENKVFYRFIVYRLPAKKLKLNDNKKIAILEYSSVQLPVASFIDYLEKIFK